MKTINASFSLIFILFFLSGCLMEDDLKQPYKGFDPAGINDGWDLSTPSAEQIDSAELDKIYKVAYSDDELWMTKSLLVFRNGKLVAESYLKDDEDRTRIDAIWSCTKQVNAIVTGIAIEEGFIGSVRDKIDDYLPDYTAKYPDKAGITIENLLMMKGGFAFDNGSQSDVFRMHRTDNSLDYVMGLDLNFAPGTDYLYNDGEPQLMSGIVQAATGWPLDEYAKSVFFDRIGMTNYEWVRYSDGVTMGGFGILTTPRELAKIAQCILDSGKAGGIQVIPRDWVIEMTGAKTTVDDLHTFGYYWWGIPEKHYIHMWGHGGQFAFIIPEKKMLVVITSLSQVDDDVNISIEYILGEIVDPIVAAAE
jgi:CubicO group peptidase (beta-lactamase class C family)